jgi:beta-lactam-binding protein with PASTA domain
MRRILTLIALCAVLTGCTTPFTPANVTPAGTNSATPATITVPDLVGKNAAVALDELHKLGFKNVDLGTVDGHEIVILPQNWTVKSQTAAPGSKLASDAKIVLGCARNG